MGITHQNKHAARVAVIYRPIAELGLDPKNPRLHSPKQIRQIARSIETFGFNVPVLVDATSKVIAGHGRIMAAQSLGLREVPTICLEHLSQPQARAFMIADNRLTDNSAWDDRLLGQQLKELSEFDLDFSLEAVGFEIGEIELRIEGLDSEAREESDSADTLPVAPLGPPVSRVGDLWMLGSHRVHCGSALDQVAYGALMQDEQAAMVFTDPPDSVPNLSGLARVEPRDRDIFMASGEMNPAEFTAFLTRAFSLQANASVDGALHFICTHWRRLAELLAAGREVYTELKDVCMWAKHRSETGSLYRSQHELIFIFSHGNGQHATNVRPGQRSRKRSNVWRSNSVPRSSDEGNLTHRTVKPVTLVADAIMDWTRRGDIVLDAFLGSGTTLIAAERTERRCHGLDIEPRHVDTVIRRWQAVTNKEAQHMASGRSFNQIEAEKEKRHGR